MVLAAKKILKSIAILACLVGIAVCAWVLFNENQTINVTMGETFLIETCDNTMEECRD